MSMHNTSSDSGLAECKTSGGASLAALIDSFLIGFKAGLAPGELLEAFRFMLKDWDLIKVLPSLVVRDDKSLDPNCIENFLLLLWCPDAGLILAASLLDSIASEK